MKDENFILTRKEFTEEEQFQLLRKKAFILMNTLIITVNLIKLNYPQKNHSLQNYDKKEFQIKIILTHKKFGKHLNVEDWEIIICYI